MEKILDDFKPDLEKLYQACDDYFNHPPMVKIKNVNQYSMYMCKTYCLLSNECRYIIAFVKEDNMPIDFKESLITLRWTSLQTRTLSEQHNNLPPHAYQPKRDTPLNTIITRTDTNPNYSAYSSEDFPITITLLHTKKIPNEYQEKGNIVAAIETYNTIICLNL